MIDFACGFDERAGAAVGCNDDILGLCNLHVVQELVGHGFVCGQLS